MNPATEADVPAVLAFLNQHAEYAMFPLANHAQHGRTGGHDRAVTFHVARKDDQITDVLTVTDGGMAMPFLPSGDYAAAANLVKNRPLIGIIARRDDTHGLRSALGLQDAPATLDHDEPHFLLDLDDLTVPDGPGTLIPIADAPRETMLHWMHDYDVEALNSTSDDARARGPQELAGRIAADSHMVLMDGDTPLAKTGFNAQLPEIVQLGGVYTPPALRGRGYARRAAALHLAQARDRGVTRATLFSASDMAARAYRAIGSRQIGAWTLLLFDGPQVAP